MKSESVADIADMIRSNAEAIINAQWEEEITTALDSIESACARARAII